MQCAEKGLKKAAEAETRQILRSMKVGAEFGTGIAEQMNKMMGITRIRAKTERLADEQLYELRYMKQDQQHKSMYVLDKRGCWCATVPIMPI